MTGAAGDSSLSETFRFLKLHAKTGVLRATVNGHEGGVYFHGGQVYYATPPGSEDPLGERLLRTGLLEQSRLEALLADRGSRDPRPLLCALIKHQDVVSTEALEAAVREQIEEAVYSLFARPEAEYRFLDGEPPSPRDLIVSLDAEEVLLEGARRVDEWARMLEVIGSLEKVPALTAPNASGKITLHTNEWDVVCHIDGHRDVNTIVAESGLDRRSVVRVIYRLARAGLVTVRDPTLDLLGQKVAVALTGPIDIYNRTFLTTICDSEISNHLRIETIEGEETEVHMAAGIRGSEPDSQLFYFCDTRTPAPVLRRMAFETSGFIVLVNVNSRDSIVASRRDVSFLKEIGDRPYVVAAYASIADEKVTTAEIRGLLDLPGSVPVIECGIRDPEDVGMVAGAILGLIP